MNNNIIIAAAVVAGIYFIIQRQKGYDLIKGKDAPGNDITRVDGSVKQLMSVCDKEPKCKGFNTNGWLKGIIGRQNLITASSDLYIKR